MHASFEAGVPSGFSPPGNPPFRRYDLRIGFGVIVAPGGTGAPPWLRPGDFDAGRDAPSLLGAESCAGALRGGAVSERREVVAVAGATGFIGRAVCAALAKRYDVVGLTRMTERAHDPSGAISWHRVDPFSLQGVQSGLAKADYAVYLLHSVQPSASLVQAATNDVDLALADNFARAAELAGVKHVVSLGRLLPTQEPYPGDLRQRLEIERALGSRSASLSALRAGPVLGPGSATTWLLSNLVRLPVMFLPAWTRRRLHPIALADVVRAIELCLDDPVRFTGTFDIGGPEVVTYRAMLRRTARSQRRRPLMLHAAGGHPKASKRFVERVGRMPRALVEPLVDGLRYDLLARRNPLIEQLLPNATHFDDAIRQATEGGPPRRPPSSVRAPREQLERIRENRSVRSIQRLPVPKGKDAEWLVQEYPRFLAKFGAPWLKISVQDNECRIRSRFGRDPLLVLRLARARGTKDRQVFVIIDGSLLRPEPGREGRLEFRLTPNGREALAAVHDYRPSLPWFLYRRTQAKLHLRFMRAFAKHLERLGS